MEAEEDGDVLEEEDGDVLEEEEQRRALVGWDGGVEDGSRGDEQIRGVLEGWRDGGARGLRERGGRICWTRLGG